jgi:hypothetical protein
MVKHGRAREDLGECEVSGTSPKEWDILLSPGSENPKRRDEANAQMRIYRPRMEKYSFAVALFLSSAESWLHKFEHLRNLLLSSFKARKNMVKGIKRREEPGLVALSLHPQVVTSHLCLFNNLQFIFSSVFFTQ